MKNTLKKMVANLVMATGTSDLYRNHMDIHMTFALDLRNCKKWELMEADSEIQRAGRELKHALHVTCKRISRNDNLLVWEESGVASEYLHSDCEGRVRRSYSEDGLVEFLYTINVSTKRKLNPEHEEALLNKIVTILDKDGDRIMEKARKRIQHEEDWNTAYDVLAGLGANSVFLDQCTSEDEDDSNATLEVFEKSM